MDARAYQPADRDTCLALLDRRGLSLQRDAFTAALDAADAQFFILEHEGTFLGCGGLERAGTSEAELVWGMIHPDWERQGLGRFLLLYRSRLCRAPFLAVTVADEFAAFYEKAGFRRKNHAGRLVKKMEVCT